MAFVAVNNFRRRLNWFAQLIKEKIKAKALVEFPIARVG